MTLRQWLYHLYWWLRMLPLPRHDDHLWQGEFDPDDPDPNVEVWDCHCGAHWEEPREEGWYWCEPSDDPQPDEASGLDAA